jgi:hypothetical protein
LKILNASYVEGFARMLDHHGFVIEHGWIELPDGTITDSTLPDRNLEYHPGVRYTQAEVLGFRKKKPPYVWGGKHGWGGYGNVDYKKAHDTAWGLAFEKPKTESRQVIDQYYEE